MEIVKSPIMVKHAIVIQDYDEILDALQHGQTVAHWEFGYSMSPMIKNKEYCVIKPYNKFNYDIKAGDAVFCRVGGYLMVHMVWMVSNCASDNHPYYLIGTTNGSIYGFTDEIYGIAKGTDVFEDVDEPKEEKEEEIKEENE